MKRMGWIWYHDSLGVVELYCVVQVELPLMCLVLVQAAERPLRKGILHGCVKGMRNVVFLLVVLKPGITFMKLNTDPL